MAAQTLAKAGRDAEAKQMLVDGLGCAKRTGDQHAAREMQAMLDEMEIPNRSIRCEFRRAASGGLFIPGCSTGVSSQSQTSLGMTSRLCKTETQDASIMSGS